MSRKIVVIGGVATGPKAASRARRRDGDAEITVIERGGLFSYAGCGMPFYIEGLIGDIRELFCTPVGVIRDERYFKAVKGIDMLGNTEALSINRGDKRVTVKGLKRGRVYDIPYDKLVLAVGARPVVSRMEGVDLDGVYLLSNPADAEAIRRELDAGAKSVAIIGGGLIGMETCGAFVSRGCRVTVFEMLDQLLPALLDRDMALLLENHLRGQGVDIRTSSRVKGLLDGGDGRVSGVSTADGGRFDADMVIIAIGVRPNVALAREAGLEIGETGAIAVNEYLQTSDPDIYAGGDCVENTCLITNRRVYTPLGSTANRHGRVIGDNVTGGSTTFPGVTRSTVFKVLDYNVGKTGLSEREARTAGYETVTSVAPREDRPHYYPTKQPFTIKLVADGRTGRLLGGQAIGQGEVVKRIDILATALRFGASVKDIADLDLGYAPPYSTAIDAVAHAANIIRNKMEGLARGIPAVDLKGKLDRGEDLILLDVRTGEETVEQAFRDPRAKWIPLGELRQRLKELPRDREIVVYCRTSVRAYEAQRILSSAGFRDVKFLEGSLAAWPYPL